MANKTKLEKSTAKQQEHADAARIPDNWPEDIKFLSDHTYTAAVDLELRAKLSHTPSNDISWIQLQASLPGLQVPNPLVTIPTIQDEKHPAFGQRGLFAKEHLLPDSCIVLYMGLVHRNSLSDTNPHSDYDLTLDGELGLSIDGATCGNEARCANDYRGVAERPNAEFRDCYVQTPSSKRAGGMRWERRVGIFVLSAGKAQLRKNGIKPGEEILVSYGKSFWEARRTVAAFRRDAEMLRIAEMALEW